MTEFTKRHLLALIALLILGAMARLAWMANAPFPDRFWMDERFTAAVAAHPFDRAMEFVAGDVHPPLYYIIIWGWNRAGVLLFGGGSGGGVLSDYDLPGIGREGRFRLTAPGGEEHSVPGLYPADWDRWALAPLWFLRIPGIVFALATAFLLWAFARRAFPRQRRLPWIATAMLLFLPFALTWDTVIRSYSMQAMWIAALFVSTVAAPHWRRAWIVAVVFASLIALALLTGYIALLALPLLAIALWRFESRPRRRAVCAAGIVFGLLLAFAIWGRQFLSQSALRASADFAFHPSQSGEFADVLWRMVYSYAVVPYLNPLSLWYWPAFGLYALAIGAVLYRLTQSDPRDAILLIALGVGAPFMASAANMIRPGAVPIQARYFYPYAPWFYLMLAYGLDRLAAPWVAKWIRRKRTTNHG